MASKITRAPLLFFCSGAQLEESSCDLLQETDWLTTPGGRWVTFGPVGLEERRGHINDQLNLCLAQQTWCGHDASSPWYLCRVNRFRFPNCGSVISSSSCVMTGQFLRPVFCKSSINIENMLCSKGPCESYYYQPSSVITVKSHIINSLPFTSLMSLPLTHSGLFIHSGHRSIWKQHCCHWRSFLQALGWVGENNKITWADSAVPEQKPQTICVCV